MEMNTIRRRDATEDALPEAMDDAFDAYWLSRDPEKTEELWSIYCAAQDQFEAYLLATRPLIPEPVRRG
jgi:hypothetical protein